MAGSTFVPAGFAAGCTQTFPSATRTSQVGIFSVNGAGEAPSSGLYCYPCHGLVRQPNANLPSASGPF